MHNKEDGNPLPWLMVFIIPIIVVLVCSHIGYHKNGLHYKEYTVGTPEFQKRINESNNNTL